eukprot:365401-Chlamydomonas_euryale.AAC.8
MLIKCTAPTPDATPPHTHQCFVVCDLEHHLNFQSGNLQSGRLNETLPWCRRLSGRPAAAWAAAGAHTEGRAPTLRAGRSH